MTQQVATVPEEWAPRAPVAGIPPLRGHRWATRRLEPGQDLYTADERTARLFVIVDDLLISRSDLDQVAELLGPGDVVNTAALASTEAWAAAYGTTVTALSPARTRSIKLTTLTSVMARNPALSLWLAASVAHRIRRIETQRLLRLDSSAGDASSLVAWILLRLQSCLGSDWICAGSRHRLSQSVLADLVGMKRETVNRSLGLMRRRGWVTVVDDHLVIVDRGALERRARHALRIAPVPDLQGWSAQ